MNIRMSAVYSALATLGLILTCWVGCSRHNGWLGTTAPDAEPEIISENIPSTPVDDSILFGYFQFTFSDGSIGVEPMISERGGDFDVTPFAWVVIDDFQFVESERNWYVTATIKNISQYDGHDVHVVFHSLGGKYVVNTDGYIHAGPPLFQTDTRLPFIAYGKDNDDREFPSMYEDTREIVIHQPDGVPSVTPIGFWIDATFNNRPEPMVEDLTLESDGDSFTLTARVFDHQSGSLGIDVYADLSDFIGLDTVLMHDDGEHTDYIAGDGIFGLTFTASPESGDYTVSISATDPDGNSGENDIRISIGETPDDPEPDPDPDPIVDGDLTAVTVLWDFDSCLTEGFYTFDDFGDEFEQAFLDLLCLMNIYGEPDWGQGDQGNNVGFGGGSDGHGSSWDDDWDEMLDEFFGSDWDEFLDGFWGKDWDDDWGPYLDEFDQGAVPFILQGPVRPTSGYWIVLDRVELQDDEINVFYTEWVPDETAWVWDYETSPWVLAIVELPGTLLDAEWNFIRTEESWTINEPWKDYPDYGN